MRVARFSARSCSRSVRNPRPFSLALDLGAFLGAEEGGILGLGQDLARTLHGVRVEHVGHVRQVAGHTFAIPGGILPRGFPLGHVVGQGVHVVEQLELLVAGAPAVDHAHLALGLVEHGFEAVDLAAQGLDLLDERGGIRGPRHGGCTLGGRGLGRFLSRDPHREARGDENRDRNDTR
jgi:hypothetical protein